MQGESNIPEKKNENENWNTDKHRNKLETYS